MLDIQIFTPTLSLSAVCDRALSVHATEEYDAPGSCTVLVPLRLAGAFVPEGMISIPGIGGGYQIETVREDGASETATITGRGILHRFAQRILADPFPYAGTAEDGIIDLAANCGGDALPGNLSCISYGIPDTVDVRAEAGSLLSVMRTLARPAGLGLHLRLDPAAREFLFSVRTRTAGGTFLSQSLGNLRSAVRWQDRKNYVNRVTVRGKDGTSVTMDAADCIRDGFDDAAAPVREYLLSVPDLSQGDFASEAAYLDALRGRGLSLLRSRRPIFSASAETDEATARRVKLGEICPLADPLLGRYAGAICTQKSLTADKNGIRHAISLSLLPDESV